MPIPKNRRTPDENKAAEAKKEAEYMAQELAKINRSKTTERYIQELVKLQIETRPGALTNSRADKEIKAISALRTAGDLIDHLAGWAIDHFAGEVLSVQELETKNQVTEAHIFDENLHEENGQFYDWSDPIANRRIAAKVIRELLFSRFGAPLSEALKALELGETMPILKGRTFTGRKALAYSIDKSRLKALEHIAYHKGINAGYITPIKAVVAEHFGISISAIANWKKRLPNSLGEAVVNGALDRAKTHGEDVSKKRIAFASTPSDDQEVLDFMLGWYQEEFNDEALRRDGRRYRYLLAQRPANTP